MDIGNFAVDVDLEFDMNPKKIGSGNFGDAYEGWRKADHFHVAIKKLKNSKLDFNEQRSFLRELTLLATLRHPNALQLVGFSLAPEVTLITPFMQNGTLEAALMKSFNNQPGHEKFTATKRMCSLYGICSTMVYIHSKNIIHRDFKPDNIFLNDDYEICIADFGLSRIVEENIYLTRGTIGTPLYMAPEVYSDDESYTNAVDVFSFGAIVYHYFVKDLGKLNDGKGPIKGKTNFFTRLMKGARFIKRESIPDQYYDLYLKCVEQNPSQRPTFLQLCEMLETNEEYLLPDVDVEEYHNYIQKCKNILEELNKPPEKKEARASKPVHKGFKY